MFNRKYYISNDAIATISKVTDDIVRQAAPEVKRKYIPHAVNADVFKVLTPEQIENIRKDSLPESDREKVVFFWNNRNARRKQSGTLIWWFKEWLDKRGLHDKAQLIMHTDPKDPHDRDWETLFSYVLNLFWG